LVLVARGGEKLGTVANELRSLGAPSVDVIVADLARVDSVPALVRELRVRHLEIDVLVNNAGYGQSGSFATTDEATELGMIQLISVPSPRSPKPSCPECWRGAVAASSTSPRRPGSCRGRLPQSMAQRRPMSCRSPRRSQRNSPHGGQRDDSGPGSDSHRFRRAGEYAAVPAVPARHAHDRRCRRCGRLLRAEARSAARGSRGDQQDPVAVSAHFTSALDREDRAGVVRLVTGRRSVARVAQFRDQDK
jgi:hypothetical protein